MAHGIIRLLIQPARILEPGFHLLDFLFLGLDNLLGPGGHLRVLLFFGRGQQHFGHLHSPFMMGDHAGKVDPVGIHVLVVGHVVAAHVLFHRLCGHGCQKKEKKAQIYFTHVLLQNCIGHPCGPVPAVRPPCFAPVPIREARLRYKSGPV